MDFEVLKQNLLSGAHTLHCRMPESALWCPYTLEVLTRQKEQKRCIYNTAQIHDSYRLSNLCCQNVRKPLLELIWTT
jgi:hypothetical protein